MMKVGIFFGGKSREREVSFAGGRTVFDSLDKSLFDPVPIFLDSLGNFVQLDWQYLYKGSIRDFYPPINQLPESLNQFQVYAESLEKLTQEQTESMIREVGKPLRIEDFPELMDFAFLCLHGPYGEDGTLQGLLTYYDIPYSGAGIYASATGIDKSIQKKLFAEAGWSNLQYRLIGRQEWRVFEQQRALFEEMKSLFGDRPVVIKSASQGSSIGVNVLEKHDWNSFRDLVNRSFFIKELSANEWAALTPEQEVNYLREIVDLQDGLGMPVMVKGEEIRHPETLLNRIREAFANNRDQNETLLIEANQAEHTVILEEYIEGKEFSCIVIQDEGGKPLALPPTEIRKYSEVFDYRAKYLPGGSHKITPIELPDKSIQTIRDQCESLFSFLNTNVYARIDGFITEDDKVYLNDPNTTSGMLPSSFFFHQAAEIGLTPGQFLTYIIRTSIAERLRTTTAVFQHQPVLEALDQEILGNRKQKAEKEKVGVILGGYSSERHISVESGRNVFEKLASSQLYDPIPIFLMKEDGEDRFYQIPINLLLKDNADDIRDKIRNFKISGTIHEIIDEAQTLTGKYGTPGYDFYPKAIPLKDFPKHMDFAFMGLHGRPGEDGTLPAEFQQMGLPYNGSGPEAGALTIDKHKTNNLLKDHRFHVAQNALITKEEWQQNPDKIWDLVEQEFRYPVVAKPSDDGCSSAVKKIDSADALKDYIDIIFRDTEEIPDMSGRTLAVSKREEFPPKNYFMVEELIGKDKAERFLEITGGLVTHYNKEGNLEYEMFEPSEALAEGGILSLEEKFLAGEGQNITPARFADDPEENQKISKQVQEELKQVAQVIGIEGYCRIDAFVRVYGDHSVDVIIIEINSLPGLTPATAIFHQAALNGYKPVDFLHRIIEFGKASVSN